MAYSKLNIEKEWRVLNENTIRIDLVSFNIFSHFEIILN